MEDSQPATCCCLTELMPADILLLLGANGEDLRRDNVQHAILSVTWQLTTDTEISHLPQLILEQDSSITIQVIF